jgi:hypothetical protein
MRLIAKKNMYVSEFSAPVRLVADWHVSNICRLFVNGLRTQWGKGLIQPQFEIGLPIMQTRPSPQFPNLGYRKRILLNTSSMPPLPRPRDCENDDHIFLIFLSAKGWEVLVYTPTSWVDLGQIFYWHDYVLYHQQKGTIAGNWENRFFSSENIFIFYSSLWLAKTLWFSRPW